ncbi:hypothetical protein BC941DRAFT_471539 [Chlamydoabsidia padenii]|nr:hypothetical protein BC941DRAFT_471539 [Chlamydoabsidia padenii]
MQIDGRRNTVDSIRSSVSDASTRNKSAAWWYQPIINFFLPKPTSSSPPSLATSSRPSLNESPASSCRRTSIFSRSTSSQTSLDTTPCTSPVSTSRSSTVSVTPLKPETLPKTEEQAPILTDQQPVPLPQPTLSEPANVPIVLPLPTPPIPTTLRPTRKCNHLGRRRKLVQIERDDNIISPNILIPPFSPTYCKPNEFPYSNFYLKLPNGKWMIRYRSGTRRIIGTGDLDGYMI